MLNAAAEFLETSPVAWANFHTFRRDVGTVRLINRENDAPVVDEQTGSLLSQEDIAALAAFEEGSSGYFGRMWSYLNDFISTGVAEGRFTQQQARRTFRLPCGTPMPGIILTNMILTIRRPSGCRLRRKTRRAAAHGIIVILWR